MHFATKKAEKEQIKKFTLEEKKAIVEKHVVQLTFSLSERLKKYRGRPQTICPNSECRKVLKKSHRIAGYRKNPADFKTTCPFCFTRFEPKLVAFNGTNELLVNLYYETHIFYLIGSWFNLSPKTILENNPGVYYSCIYNFGSLKAAFKAINIKYDYSENPYWIEAVTPYLGKLSDLVIAKSVLTSPAQISILRRKKGIKKFSSAEVFKHLLKTNNDLAK